MPRLPTPPNAAPAPALDGAQGAGELSTAQCYPALLARDARFDGLWFVGVSSTGIYCRPVCRVKTPRRENCRFFASAAQAESAGYRPCLRCRPETAPGAQLRWSVTDASRTLARQAAALMAEDPRQSVTALAARLGISSRHLQRIFEAEHGVPPLAYLHTRRLLLAKQLLMDSPLGMAEVAAAAGFGSQRRFNALFQQHYRLQPGSLRKAGEPPPSVTACGEPGLRLAYRPPLAVDALLGFLAARAVPGVEHVDAHERLISRSLRLPHQGRTLAGRLVIRFQPERDTVLLSPCSSLWAAAGSLIPLVRRWLDLDAAPDAIHQHLAGLPSLEPGLRLPGCLDRFELAVRAVLGQQVTVAAARTLASRFVERFGEDLPPGHQTPEVRRLFPLPERIAGASIESIAELGIIRNRAQALITLAQRWPTLAYARLQDGHLAGGQDLALSELQDLPGIGPWTAQYMLMRGWSAPDLFPPGDVVLRQQLTEPGQAAPTPRALAERAQGFSPYRSYAVLQLWHHAAQRTPATAASRKT
ncbi:Ada metal-binding domain-containing protein [Pelomonas sp. APW6]|uniref:DNA-3-methyladenine glycosylase II n=1 Tax=Roseateles subflavus TaxID=3053353 RepID=A0ABT7LQY1_9BURK|nr:Ada metal-binding domain-containing protein [Pelomonas sp. APW6]MDL5034540.1 Ada metal-binding domain-containing protein [Pelomonas sp. APW6]